MRILIVSRNLPYPLLSGEKIRVFHLLKGLATNHEVSLLTPISDPNEYDLVGNLKHICKEVHSVLVPSARLPFRTHAAGLFSSTPYYSVVMPSPGLNPQLSVLLKNGSYDLIQVENLAAAHWIAPLRGVAKIIDMHNVDSTYFWRQTRYLRLGARQLLTISDAIKLPWYQRRLIPQFDRCLVVSEFDAEQLRCLVPGASLSVVPNGVDPEEFCPDDTCEQPSSLVFMGSFPYLPNTDAVIFFCTKILGLIRRAVPDLRVFIVGQTPPREIAAMSVFPGVEVTGRVPDIRPYLARAAVVIVPLRLGSGTRLKVLQAMAMGKAIVSTAIGVEGLNVRPGRDLEIADGPAEFAERTIAVLRNPERRARLGVQARQTVMRQYTWTQILGRLESIYEDIRSHERTALPPLGASRAAT